MKKSLLFLFICLFSFFVYATDKVILEDTPGITDYSIYATYSDSEIFELGDILEDRAVGLNEDELNAMREQYKYIIAEYQIRYDKMQQAQKEQKMQRIKELEERMLQSQIELEQKHSF